MEYREDIVREMVTAIVLKTHQQIVAYAEIFNALSSQSYKRAKKIRIRKDETDIARIDGKEDAENDGARWYALAMDLCYAPFTGNVMSLLDEKGLGGKLSQRHAEILSRICSYLRTPEPERGEPPDFSDLFPTAERAVADRVPKR